MAFEITLCGQGGVFTVNSDNIDIVLIEVRKLLATHNIIKIVNLEKIKAQSDQLILVRE